MIAMISDISAFIELTIGDFEEKYNIKDKLKQSSSAKWSLLIYLIKVESKRFGIF